MLPYFYISKVDLLILWRNFFICLTWIVVTIYVFSGIQDFIYDIWGYTWRIVRRRKFKGRERLSLARMKLREQQMIAVFVPAWKEAGVVDKMLTNIIERVEYRNYFIFVGTYPNDRETQEAVDKLVDNFPQIIKVVTSRPGPTNKADCLNHIYSALKEYEKQHNIFFEIIVLHDAEDYVHPYSFLLYNYLIPRVDAVQLPILPLPTQWFKWVHWVYADEFAENHMKDIIVRERMQGFVPYAGVGTGFSRRLFNHLDKIRKGQIFNENTLTEDYSTAKAARDAGMTSVFVNVILADDKSPWYKPLFQREFFISNWSYFPSDFWRSVKQKTRWIVGISLQEWRQSKWKGSLAVKENFIKDRKGLVSFTANILGYIVLMYVLIYFAGQKGILPFKWEPIFHKGTPLFTFIIIATFFMSIRIIQRVIFVTIIYGIGPGLLSIPRLFLGNIINGFASFRALLIFLKTFSEPTVKWEKTEHYEGAGINPVDMDESGINKVSAESAITCTDFIKLLETEDTSKIIEGFDKLKHTCSPYEHKQMLTIMQKLLDASNIQVKILAAKMFSKLKCKELIPFVKQLLFDREWIVRSNAAKVIIRSNFLKDVLKAVMDSDDKYAKDVLVKTLEQNEWAFYRLLPQLSDKSMSSTREKLFSQSKYLEEKYNTISTTD
ncbi:MAG: glycosyltransferase [bacterium]|nr:glycosyltransferase [bacterium]